MSRDQADKQEYQINHDTKKIEFYAEHKFGKNLTYSLATIQKVLQLYSNFDGVPHTTAEISRKTGIPKDRLTYIIKILGITHNDLPVLPDADTTVEELLELKDSSLLDKFDQADQKKIKADADKWRALKFNQIDPFEKFLSSWEPPILPTKTGKKLTDRHSNKVFVIALSDLHFGSFANHRYMFNGKSWSTAKTVEAVNAYADEIVNEVSSRNYRFKKCVIMGLGDLIHSVSGKTQRGTELIYDCIKEEQFDYAMNSLLAFFTKMAGLFDQIEVHNVGGNHHYELDMALFKALDLYFRPNKGIKFTHHSTRPAAFKCDNTLFMMDHGADSKERVYVPSGAKLEKHVQSILLNNTHLLADVKTKIFVQGDKHHFEHLEFGTFEYIMFSTILGADEHASVNNWHNRARQSCLVLDSSGLKEIIHIYFD
jgi:hypothetical protein